MRVRHPAFADMFYPAKQDELENELLRCFEGAAKGAASPAPLGLVIPHAGYVYSGRAAASAFSAVADQAEFDSLVIIGPNHTGFGPAISVGAYDAWETPLGIVHADVDLIDRLDGALPGCRADTAAHQQEHSIEVQLPFAQMRLAEGFKLLPIAIGLEPGEEGLARCIRLADVLEEALGERRALLVASSDMSHYVSASRAEQDDDQAIRAMSRMDASELVRVVRERRIGMCGVMPAVTVMRCAAHAGATRGILLDYRHSGETSGDCGRVVSYAAMALVS